MTRVSRLRYLYLAYFHKPKAERTLYRRIRSAKMSRLVEIGVGNAQRAGRLIQVALRYAGGDVQYTGIDLFEAAPDKSGTSLIHVHRHLAPLGAKVRLVPGEPAAALAGVANSLPNSDLVVLSAAITDQALEDAWFYLPRMIHAATLVFRERRSPEGEPQFHLLSPYDIQARASSRSIRRAA